MHPAGKRTGCWAQSLQGAPVPSRGGGGGVEIGGGHEHKTRPALRSLPSGKAWKIQSSFSQTRLPDESKDDEGKKNPEFFTLKRENKTCVLSCVFSFPEKTKDGKPGTVFARQVSGNIPKRPSLDFYSSLAVGRPEQRNIIHAFSCLHMLLLSHPQAAQADSRTCLPDIKSSSLA